MIIVWAVASLLVPGIAASYTRQWRAGLAWLAAAFGTLAASALSVWLIPLVISIHLASVTDGVRRIRANRRLGEPTRLSLVGMHLLASVVLGTVVRGGAVTSFRIPSTSGAPTLQIGDHVMADKLSLLWHPVEPGDLVAYHFPCAPEITRLNRVIATAGQRVEVRCEAVFVDGQPVVDQAEPGPCEFDDVDDFAGWSTRPCSLYTESLHGHTFQIFGTPERPKPSPSHGSQGDFPSLDRTALPSCRDNGGSEAPQTLGTLTPLAPGMSPCAQQLAYVVPAGHVFMLGDNRPNSNDSRYWGAVPVGNIIARIRGIYASAGKSGFGFTRFAGVK